MSLTVIPNQPIAFQDSRILGCSCFDPDEVLLASSTDTLSFQVQWVGCLGDEQLDSPSFESAGDWLASNWNISTGHACATSSGSDYLQEASFNPTAGHVYFVRITVESMVNGDARDSGLDVTFGGALSETITSSGTFAYITISTSTAPLVFQRTHTDVDVCLAMAEVYEMTPDLTVDLLQGASVIETFDYDSNPERFSLNNGYLTVSLPFSEIEPDDGCYNIRITDGCDETTLTSQLVNIGSHSCTLVITACNASDSMGFSGFVASMRVIAKVTHPTFEYDVQEERLSNGFINRYYADRRRKMELRIDRLGEFGHDFISTLPLYDHVYIEDAEYVVSADGYAPGYGDVYDAFGGIILQIEPKQELARKVLCGEDDGGCAPPPNYWVENTGPNSDYILQEENLDRILLNS